MTKGANQLIRRRISAKTARTSLFAAAIVPALLFTTAGASYAAEGAPEAANGVPAAHAVDGIPAAPSPLPKGDLVPALAPMAGESVPAPKLNVDLAKAQKFTDPLTGVTVHRATRASEGKQGRLRHDYSRRQAFNADNSKMLAWDGEGFWYVVDTKTWKRSAALEGVAGAAEVLWHPTNPNLARHTANHGGTQWYEFNVSTGERRTILDLKGKTPWPEATSYWTKGEGTTSADGKILTLFANRYDSATQKVIPYGVVTVNLESGSVIGTLDASKFPVPGAIPDHVSTSASGKYAVLSWTDGYGGTHSYDIGLKKGRQLIKNSEHSDLAINKEGRDVLVAAAYEADQIAMYDLETGKKTGLMSLYPASGEAYAAHISAQSFDRPGWVVVSTYGDNANYGKAAAPSRPQYKRVFFLELTEGGQAYPVTHTRVEEKASDSKEGFYFKEPQATVSRDGSKVAFTSTMGGGIETWVVDIPLKERPAAK
ncbi:MAG: hypothetical protein Q4C87_01745 [Actinomycetaceae bacterium]|nr:hypothetical protein [Actinomycetaceae bacterium]